MKKGEKYSYLEEPEITAKGEKVTQRVKITHRQKSAFLTVELCADHGFDAAQLSDLGKVPRSVDWIWRYFGCAEKN
jgi:hypothetical protein